MIGFGTIINCIGIVIGGVLGLVFGNLMKERLLEILMTATALCVLLVGVDKEAAFFYGFIGYYPILKPIFDQKKGKWLWKMLFFNTVILLTYWLMMHLFGFDSIETFGK